jgi:lipoate-protein ligase A
LDLYNLWHVPWLDSQLLYHALPRVGGEGLFILAPSEPYVCIGYHQDLAQEVDAVYCREHSIPIFRREVGGGAVFLDGQQIFYQLILHCDNPLAQGDKEALYRRLLQPVVEAYQDLGVDARYRPVNDIVTAEGRKIAGTGAATIGDYIVMVGNLIADFDYDTMVHVLRVPDEKYRDRVFKSMRENLTTLLRETGRRFTWDELATPLCVRFEALLGKLNPQPVPLAVRQEAERLKVTFLSEDWLYRAGRQRPAHDVRIASGVNIVQRVYKAPGGLLRATMEIKDGVLADVALSGDFFCYPQEAVRDLEAALASVPLADLAAALDRFYRTHTIETPGVSTADWLALVAG